MESGFLFKNDLQTKSKNRKLLNFENFNKKQVKKQKNIYIKIIQLKEILQNIKIYILTKLNHLHIAFFK